MEQNYECKFCNKKFHKEQTLTTHICVKKRRYMDKDTAGSRFGFRVYQRFYELSTKSKKPKTMDDFIDSPYYIDFVKFGNHLALLKPMFTDKFIDFVILGQVKLKDWCKDEIYYLYIDNFVKSEPAMSATERTILEMSEWCDKNGHPINEFFNQISPNEAAHMIMTGKISPWVIYLSDTGGNLTHKFNEDHARMVSSILDSGFWIKRFKKESDEVDHIKSVLEAVKI